MNEQQILTQIQSLLDCIDTFGLGDGNELHLPTDYAPYVDAIFDRWPHLTICIGGGKYRKKGKKL